MKFNIVTTFDNYAQADALADALEALGHKQTFRWTIYHPRSKKLALVLDDNSQQIDYQTIALQELAAVAAADVVIALWPCDENSHCAIGAALTLSKPLFLVGGPEAFAGAVAAYQHPRVVRFAKALEEIDVAKDLVPLLTLAAAGHAPALPEEESAA